MVPGFDGQKLLMDPFPFGDHRNHRFSNLGGCNNISHLTMQTYGASPESAYGYHQKIDALRLLFLAHTLLPGTRDV